MVGDRPHLLEERLRAGAEAIREGVTRMVTINLLGNDGEPLARLRGDAIELIEEAEPLRGSVTCRRQSACRSCCASMLSGPGTGLPKLRSCAAPRNWKRCGGRRRCR